MKNSMLNVFIVFLKLCWTAATTTKLKLKLLSNVLVSIVNGLFLFCAPLFLSFIIQNLTDKNTSLAVGWFIGLAVLTATWLLTRLYWRYSVESVSVPLEMNLRSFYYQKLFHKPYKWHLNNSVGYFSSALDRVCTNMDNWLCNFPIDYFPSVILVGCFFVYTFVISPWLFLYFICVLAGMGIITRLMYNKRIGLINNYTRENLKYNKLFVDFLYNIRSVKKMNLFSFTKRKIEEHANQATEKSIAMMHYNAIQWGVMETIIQGVFLIPAGFYLLRYIWTGSGLDVMVMLSAIQPQMGQSGRMMMHIMTASAKVLIEYEKLSEHLGEDVIPNKAEYAHKWKEIRFDNTLFEYVKDGHIFSHQVQDFSIHRGDHVAVTGRSGEGKSTFLNLLTGQFPLKSGHIMVDDESYETISQDFFDRHVTYISQDVELFNMSFYDNIVMGKKIPDKQLQKVLEGCQLTELIDRMQGNLHCDLGEKGIKVSGGERQRINLARGLLLGRDILVLDEVTANLDPFTTQKIWEFIFTEYGNKTIIAVSHETDLLNHTNRRIEFKRGVGKEIVAP